jgi:hypothetical protein
MQVGPAVQTSAAHAINAATSKIMARNRIGNAVAAMRSDRRAARGGRSYCDPKGIQRSARDVRVPSLWIRQLLACPSTVVA